MGRRSFVSIHTRPTVPQDPPPEVYRDVGDALQILVALNATRVGKGLIIDALTYALRPCPVDAFGCSVVALAAYFNVISVF